MSPDNAEQTYPVSSTNDPVAYAHKGDSCLNFIYTIDTVFDFLTFFSVLSR